MTADRSRHPGGAEGPPGADRRRDGRDALPLGLQPDHREARDACHGLYHATTGDTLVQGTKGLPIFVGAMAFAVKAVIAKVEREGGLEPGDTFLFNDPYSGGTHLNDFRLVRPVFRDGKLFCWLASVGHWLDIGGNVPGGYNPKATRASRRACASHR